MTARARCCGEDRRAGSRARAPRGARERREQCPLIVGDAVAAQRQLALEYAPIGVGQQGVVTRRRGEHAFGQPAHPHPFELHTEREWGGAHQHALTRAGRRGHERNRARAPANAGTPPTLGPTRPRRARRAGRRRRRPGGPLPARTRTTARAGSAPNQRAMRPWAHAARSYHVPGARARSAAIVRRTSATHGCAPALDRPRSSRSSSRIRASPHA